MQSEIRGATVDKQPKNHCERGRHRWGNWQAGFDSVVNRSYQMRKCLSCGKTQIATKAAKGNANAD